MIFRKESLKRRDVQINPKFSSKRHSRGDCHSDNTLPMKILLTGASGFIGHAFAQLALARGHEVAALTRPDFVAPPELSTAGRLVYLRGTLAEPPWEDIAKFAPETCLHTAWVTAPRVAYDSPQHFDCLEWSKTFLAGAVQRGVRHIISVGTCIEYELGNQPLAEDRTPLKPIGPYPTAKNQLRIFLEEESRKHGLTLCWPRVFYAYGVGEHPGRLCSSIIHKLRSGETISLKTPASTKDYIYVADTANALMTLAEQQSTGTINICTGIGVTILDLAQTLAGLLGRPELIVTPAEPAMDPLGFVVGDSTRLRSLGWKPDYDLRRGLETMAEVNKA
jgi:nucleoside-diphosphate-sugar epimerase